MKWIQPMAIIVLCPVLLIAQKKEINEIEKISFRDKELTIEEVMKEMGLPSLSVAVVDNYEIVWSQHWGIKDTETKEPIDELTAYSTASIAKPITAVLLAVLEEKGMINLSRPVNDYLKRWKIPENDYTEKTPVTLEHLLSHTGGTTQHGFTDFYEGDQVPTIVESVKGKLPRYDNEIEVTFEPGTNWSYSGGGYTIVQMAIEDHLNIPLADLMEEYLFAPLDLKNTTLKQPNERGFLSNVAKAHDRGGNIIRTGIPITPQLAASGVWSNSTDMAKILIEIQKALDGQPTKVISKKAAERVTKVQTIMGIGGWSLGWERRFFYGNRDWFSHGGSNTGVGGHIYATMEEGKGIAFFGNGPNSVRIPILEALRDQIVKDYNWAKPFIKPETIPISVQELQQLRGRYLNDVFGEIVEVKIVDSKLEMSAFAKELHHIGNNTFLTPEYPNQFKFARNPENGILYLSIIRDGVDEINYWFRKLDTKTPEDLVRSGEYEKALGAYKKELASFPESSLARESSVNRLGYQLMREENLKGAIEVFKINVKLYPKSGNVYDSLGEAYLAAGNKREALRNYSKAYEIDQTNFNAKKIIDQLQEDLEE